MLTNKQVIKAWLEKRSARSCNLLASGAALYSYDLLIGYIHDGLVHVYDYTGKNKVSNTTSRHIGLVRPYADVILRPDMDRVLKYRAIAIAARDERASANQ